MTALDVSVLTTVVLTAVLVVAALRSHAAVLRRLHDDGIYLEHTGTDEGHEHDRGPDRALDPPPWTSPAAAGRAGPDAEQLPRVRDVAGTAPDGRRVVVEMATRRDLVLLAFLTGSCDTCQPFWDELADAEVAGGEVVVVMRSSDRPPVPSRTVTVVLSDDAWDHYGVRRAPHFVLLDPRRPRALGEGSGSSWAQVTGLLGRYAADLERTALTRASNAEREAWVDRALAAHGIGPDHPSLRPAGPAAGGASESPTDG